MTEKSVRQPEQDDFSIQVLGLMERIVEKWEQLDRLLRVEWHSLLNNDFSKLYKIFQAKQVLSEQIADREKALSRLLAAKIAKKRHGSYDLSRELMRILGPETGRKALIFLKRRNYLRQVVFITNDRIIAWIKEKLVFMDELSRILSGQSLVQKATYGPGSSKKRPSFSLSVEKQQLKMMTEKSFSRQALNIYTALQNTTSARTT